jgi:general secretion pathway protein G
MNKTLCAAARTITIAIVAMIAIAGFIFSACHHSPRSTKEAILKQSLYEMRSAIDKYTVDKERAPQRLQDLVTAGYLKSIPLDPITKSADTWQIEMESAPASPNLPAGIANICSGAKGSGPDGIAYHQY